MRLLRLAAGHTSGLESHGARFHRPCRRFFSRVAAILESRAVLEISGVDAKSLLQGLMTNDMSLLDTDVGDHTDSLPCISTAFLSSKGRVLGDAMVTRSPRHDASKKPGYLMDCPLSVAEDLKTQLKVYKLRSKVKIKDATALYDVLVSGVHDPWQGATEKPKEGNKSPVVGAAAASQPKSNGVGEHLALFEDPRSASLGVRFIRPKGETDSGGGGDAWAGDERVVSEERYNALRMAHGVGEGIELVNSIPHESNLDLLGAISFTKGCYVGQELTARTQFKGFVRKRLLPVLFPSADNLVEWGSGGSSVAPPIPGLNILERSGDKKKLGTIVSVSPEYNVGLALLRLSNVIDGHLQEADGDATAGKMLSSLIVEASGHGERRCCEPLLPAWWARAFDPTTGKLPA